MSLFLTKTVLRRGAPSARPQERQTEGVTEHTVLAGPQPEDM